MEKFYNTQVQLEKLYHDKIVPGLNFAIINQKQVTAGTLGYSQWIPKKKQLTPLMQYDIASLTKVVGTTTVFLKLYQEGRLNFTEPIGDFLDSFKGAPVRIQHLLTHTSGIKGYIPNRDQLSKTELIEAILNLPITNEFEQKAVYSDTNFILLGLIAEKIYNQPIQDLIMAEAVKPLQLNYTTFHPEKEKTVPTNYIPGEGLLQGIVHDPKARTLQERCGSSGLFAPLYDLTKFVKYLSGVKKNNVLDNETINLLFGNKTPKHVKSRTYGWDLLFDPIHHYPLLYHTGFTGTFMIIDRRKQTGLVVLTNRVHPSSNNQAFLTARELIIETFLKENT
ncbi:serine hydrolase domain-containing protein [Holzapfeliella sp. He02]|uniref:Serine hydrolase domain-containing protein n=1 Tax=Holzapfeliella saturejae TaxID=3082953 RepID=A0ABU8SFX4_9LACO